MGVDGKKIVPDDDAVHFEHHHIVEIALIIVDDVSPRPETAFLDGGRRLIRKVGNRVFLEEIHTKTVRIIRIFIGKYIKIIKVDCAVDCTRIVEAFNGDGIVSDRDAVFL